MKKYIAAALIALIPHNANSFELTIPFSWGADGFHIGETSGDIMQIAMRYNGYDTKNNRKELQALMDIDPVKTPSIVGVAIPQVFGVTNEICGAVNVQFLLDLYDIAAIISSSSIIINLLSGNTLPQCLALYFKSF